MEKQSLIDKAVAAFQIRFNNTPKEVGLHIQTVYKDSVIFSPSEKEAMSFIANQKDMQNYIGQCFVFCVGLVVYMAIGLICFTFSPDSFIGFWIGGAILSILFLILTYFKSNKFKKNEKVYKGKKLVIFEKDGGFVEL
jgi:hypothetical protein